MERIKAIAIAGILMCNVSQAFSQDSLFVNFLTGTYSSISFDDLKSIKFYSKTILVSRKGEQDLSIPVEQIRYLTFEKLPGTIPPQVFEDELTLYPNPMTGELLTVNFQFTSFGYVRIDLYDLQGAPVKTTYRYAVVGTNSFTWTLEEIPKGVYNCMVSFEDQPIDTKKIVKQ